MLLVLLVLLVLVGSVGSCPAVSVTCRLPNDFHAHYKLEQEIGRGAWATVQLATELKTGEKYMSCRFSYHHEAFALLEPARYSVWLHADGLSRSWKSGLTRTA